MLIILINMADLLSLVGGGQIVLAHSQIVFIFYTWLDNYAVVTWQYPSSQSFLSKQQVVPWKLDLRLIHTLSVKCLSTHMYIHMFFPQTISCHSSSLTLRSQRSSQGSELHGKSWTCGDRQSSADDVSGCLHVLLINWVMKTHIRPSSWTVWPLHVYWFQCMSANVESALGGELLWLYRLFIKQELKHRKHLLKKSQWNENIKLHRKKPLDWKSTLCNDTVSNVKQF